MSDMYSKLVCTECESSDVDVIQAGTAPITMDELPEMGKHLPARIKTLIAVCNNCGYKVRWKQRVELKETGYTI